MDLSALHNKEGLLEAGCDEAGRGCLAGPVFAAAVIFPPNYSNKLLNDSKQLSEKARYKLRKIIEDEAICYAVASCSNTEVDELNILRASIVSMHRSLEKLKPPAQFIIIDGNRFYPYQNIKHECIVKGDGKYLSIAAASVLAKTYRDDFMNQLHKQYPNYQWNKNKGYPTKAHREAIREFGATEHHRKSFNLLPKQMHIQF
jgi:ribonuclease HII